jgi:hypothetical protein
METTNLPHRSGGRFNGDSHQNGFAAAVEQAFTAGCCRHWSLVRGPYPLIDIAFSMSEKALTAAVLASSNVI